MPKSSLYSTTTYNGGNVDTSGYRAPARKSQASGLSYAAFGGRNLGRTGIPQPSAAQISNPYA